MNTIEHSEIDILNRNVRILVPMVEKEKYLHDWKKELIKCCLCSTPGFALLIFVGYIGLNNLLKSIDIVPINLMTIGFSLMYLIIYGKDFYSEIVGYNVLKKQNWYRSIIYITTTDKKGIHGKYYKDGILTEGLIKRKHGDNIGKFRMHYATMIEFEKSPNIMVLASVEWNKEVEKINTTFFEF